MQQTQIVFLLLPKFHLQDLAGAAQVFYEAAELSNGHFKLHYVSPYREIVCAQGLPFSTLEPLEKVVLKKRDVLCIPGFDYKACVSGELDDAIAACKDWVWAQREKDVYLASVCTGALALAKMGLLDHTQYTCHWKCLEYMKTTFPKAKQLDNRLYVFDKGIFTSAGMTSGIDMALALVERWRTPLLAAKVAQEMVINVRRAETKKQENIFLDFKNHFNADVYKAQEILANRLEASFSIGNLAKMMNLSTRHLARLFKHHTGETIQHYRDKMRLEHGEELMLNTEMSVKEIALACGFENTRQFSRLWQKMRGTSPGRYKKQVQELETSD